MINGHYVLIVAAGRGNRAKRDDSSLPKQYVSLGGQAVLTHVLEKFAGDTLIDGIITVIHPDDEAEYRRASRNIGDKLLPFVPGGETRQQSVFNGLVKLAEYAPSYVHIHDGARPCFSSDLVARIGEKLKFYPAVIPALPLTDTIKKAFGGIVSETLDRADLYRVQTPQSFKFDMIFSAHKAALEAAHDNDSQHDNETIKGALNFTDDASIAEWHGVEVHLIEGEEENIKITTAADFTKGERQLSKDQDLGDKVDIRMGHGFDVHAFEEGDAVILCGVSIPFDKKLKGHSDADVGLHALTDAIYGALADGDIGVHFPPTDPQWKGAASDVFLKAAAEAVSTRGGVINNVDVTLICEAPKISPYAVSMRRRVSQLIGIDLSRVSVKATTTERLGFTGREEGISAMATATLRL